MVKVGIIAEYNPFHKGHLYHIHKIKGLFPDSLLVLVLSSCFTERGIPSILNKWDKTEIALHYGVDLVVELPFPFATQSADIFARGAISILKELKVDYLVFGSESNDIEMLTRLAQIQLDKKYQEEIKQEIKKGINYPTALSKALKKLGQNEINLPNDILGISYIREIIKQKAKITPLTIQRTNEYHSKELKEKITSATSIRLALEKKQDIKAYVPSYTYPYLKRILPTMEDYFPYLKYQIYTNQDHLEGFQTVDEGIDKRILKFIDKVDSYADLVQKIKTKRYTYNRINRMFVHILCQFTKEEASSMKEITYLRILGFSVKGQKYLHEIKKNTKIPIITRLKDLKDIMLAKEQQVTKIYALVFPLKDQKKLIEKEYKTPPINP